MGLIKYLFSLVVAVCIVALFIGATMLVSVLSVVIPVIVGVVLIAIAIKSEWESRSDDS